MVRTQERETRISGNVWQRRLCVSLCLLTILALASLTGCSGGSTVSESMAVSSMSPNTAYTTGGQVVFSGANFTPNMTVMFGGVAAQKIYFQSSTLATAITPVVTAAGTVDVAISTPGGGSVTLPKALTYTVPPPPVAPGQCSTLPCTYQAAASGNTLLGTASVKSCTGCTNNQKVGSLGFGGWVIINNVYAPTDGNYTLTIVGVEGAGTQTYKVIVNGGTAVSEPLSGNNWDASAPPVSITVPLKAGGGNTIQLGNDTDWSPDVVSIAISSAGGSSGPPIALASIAPNQVLLTGGQVVLTGTNLTAFAAVTFGGAAATSTSLQSSTQLTATAPAVKSGGAVDVVVSSPAGGIATLSKGLTYIQCASMPCTYQAADGENTLVGNAAVGKCTGCAQGVKVGSLGNASDVIFNNVYAPAAGNYTLTITGCEGAGTQDYQVIVDGGTPITVPLTGNNWDAPAAPVSITIDLAAGGSNTIELGNANNYSPDVVSIALSAANTATIPTIATVAPNQLPITGGQVVITGTNFTSATTVTFGGVAAPPISFQSTTQITVTAPANATVGAVDVLVTSPADGTATLSKGLSYVEPGACTSGTCVYQAWDPQNKLNGGAAVATCAGCPNGLKVGNMGYGNGVTFNNVYAPAAGDYIVTLVGCEGGGTQTYQVSANGGTANNVPLYGNNWYVSTPPVSTVVALNAGSTNTITVTNSGTWSPDIVSIAVNPANTGTSSLSQPVTMSNGQNLVTYDLSTGFATFASGGQTKITGFYSEAYSGSTLYRSTSSSYNRTSTNGANGETDITLTASDGSPTMIQRFIMSANHFTVQVELDGATAGSNEMSPLVANQAGAVDTGSYTDPRFLIVPYDNNAYYNYNAETSNGLSDTGYEVGAFYDNTSRNGLVIGSVTHDTWKTGIQFTGNANKLDFLWAYGGANSTGDQLPHGSVSGAKILSPVVMVGYYDDWRNGMEDFANTNAQYAPMLAWTGPAPMGWNSWGKIQNNLSYTNATAVEDYFHTQLPNYNNNGVVYINLDNYWTNLSDSELQSFVSHAHSQGQKAGIYWTPFIIWNWTDLTTAVDGAPNYKFGDIVMKYANGTPMGGGNGAVDGAWGADPTHPGTQQRIDYYINKFKTMGFDYLKLDFLIHGALEGGSNNGALYDTTVHTGTQAYSQAMKRLYTDVGTSMLIDESIAPLFPYQYAHTRRVAGDTYGSIEDTKREMASASYGWWMAGRIYNWNDPDEMLLEGTETPSGSTTAVPITANENKSRVTSGAVAGFMLNGDDVTDAGSPPLVQKWLTNPSINGLPALGLNFRPVEGNTGTTPVNVLVAQQGNVYYVAVFNYDITNPLSTTVDLGRAGLNSSTAYSVTDLWSGKTSSATFSLPVSLGAAESTILKLQ